MKLKYIALIAGLLPLISAFTSYIVAASNGHVEWCIPFIHGCTSISANGRAMPESFIYRPLMIISAVVMVAYWKLSFEWLCCKGDPRIQRIKTMMYLGMVAALFFIIYTTFLGSNGQSYQFARRIGVVVFFSFTLIAQLIYTNEIRFLIKSQQIVISKNIDKIKLGIVSVLLALGLISIPASYYDRPENTVEWLYGIILHIYFIATYVMWKGDTYQANFSVSNKNTSDA